MISLAENKKWTTIGPVSGPVISLVAGSLHANYITIDLLRPNQVVNINQGLY